MDSRVNGDYLAVNRESGNGKPKKQVYIGRDGQMLVICPALPAYSCGDAHQQTTLRVSPFDRGRRERHGMLYA